MSFRRHRCEVCGTIFERQGKGPRVNTADQEALRNEYICSEKCKAEKEWGGELNRVADTFKYRMFARTGMARQHK